MIKMIPVEQAVGMVLGHDITRIVPGEFKGRAFKRGKVIQNEDISVLLDLGKRHVYVLDLDDGYLHEDEAALKIAQAAAGPGIKLTSPSEGRVNLIAESKGLLKINVEALHRINSIEDIVFSTIHTGQQVRAHQAVAGTRIIPLVTQAEKVTAVEQICREHFPLMTIQPFKSLKVGVVTTGSEIYNGRIEDKFGPVLQKKFSDLGSQILRQVFVSDDVDMTVRAINRLIEEGAEMIAVTGGMSVDPDDQTPTSIRAAGGVEVIYGSPIFPGAMFMLAYINDIPIVGLPGCVMYHRASIFDLVVPRLLAGECVSRDDIVALGHGGYCYGCAECRYPACGFGK